MTADVLDDFEDLSGWTAIASGLAEIRISQDAGLHGKAMRLDFDFKGGGGFVVARKAIPLALPESYSISFDVRGAAPPNRLELKLCDASGHNVWWYHVDAFDFPREWKRVRVRSSDIRFAWGPAGGGAPSNIAAVELVIAAGPGGKGTLWVEDLRLADESYRGVAVLQASSSLPGHAPSNAMDRSVQTSWRNDPSDATPWLLINFQEQREYGGAVVHWERSRRAHKLRVLVSNDGSKWDVAHAFPCAGARRSYLCLPGTVSRFLRLEFLEATAGREFGVAEIDIQPYEFGRSTDDFLHAVAEREPRGHYPRYFQREQTYWTPVGLPDGETCAVMNEDGMVEVDAGAFSIEPFVFADGCLWTWADAEPAQQLEHGGVPVPTSLWRIGDLELAITAFVARVSDHAVLFLRYRVRNVDARPRGVRLFAVLRPFQVTPPWQAFRKLGGVSPISHLEYGAGAVRVNRARTVVSLDAPSRVGMACFDEGAIAEFLGTGVVPERTVVDDASGFASGALGYDLDLAAGAQREVYLAVPFGEGAAAEHAARELLAPGFSAADQFQRTLAAWQDRLGAVELHLPPSARAHADTFRTAAAHVLVCRDGAALQPGPRRYMRSWIRDGAVMAAALLRMGCAREAVEFVRWYARFQADDGNVPCAVDRDGPDWLAEHDSHGELIFAVMDCFRFTRDRSLLAEMWPAVEKAARYIERLRSRRLTAEYDAAAKRACYGLLPESVSHEGYLAHPVHSYWDDFWALRGLRDAAEMAELLGHGEAAARFSESRDSLARALSASIALITRERGLDYVPSSVEWADFDPTATAIAVSLLDEAGIVPRDTLERTFEQYLTGFRRRLCGQSDRAHYTPYEIRIIAALVRLDRRDSAHELADYFLGDRRPSAWNQWPEIAWCDVRSPGHLGDVPHAWIGAEYVLALRDMFAFERDAHRTLVVAAGVPDAWLKDRFEVSVRNLPTSFGNVSLSVQRESDAALRLVLSGELAVRPRHIVLRPPLAHPLSEVEVNGRMLETFDAQTATIEEWPAEVVLMCAERS